MEESSSAAIAAVAASSKHVAKNFMIDNKDCNECGAVTVVGGSRNLMPMEIAKLQSLLKDLNQSPSQIWDGNQRKAATETFKEDLKGALTLS